MEDYVGQMVMLAEMNLTLREKKNFGVFFIRKKRGFCVQLKIRIIAVFS